MKTLLEVGKELDISLEGCGNVRKGVEVGNLATGLILLVNKGCLNEREAGPIGKVLVHAKKVEKCFYSLKINGFSCLFSFINSSANYMGPSYIFFEFWVKTKNLKA